jgi:hypothetical protein
MADKIAASIVRILDANEDIVGAGFLVSEKHVFTCAHVIVQALGIPENGREMPNGKIRLDFPLVALGKKIMARVVFWSSIKSGTSTSSEGGEDIATLELEREPPPASKPAPLVTMDDLWGHSFRAFGFPGGYDKGVWASGRLLAKQGSGWLQIEDVKQTGYFVEPGFSGTPVWDEQADGVVGMVVTVEKRTDIRAAFIIPTATLINVRPSLSLPHLSRTEVDKSELRRRMLKSFDRERLEILCADINARLERDGNEVRVSPEIVGGRSLEAIILNLIDYLDRRGLLTSLLDVVRKTQPGLI